MEIKKILKIITKNKTFVLFMIALGLILGTIVGVIAEKYTATGSFFIGRSVDTNSGNFTYEGYYAQQTAATYTNTAIALIKSAEVRRSTLEKMGIEITDTTLKESERLITIKKSGPQLITVKVKGSESEKSSFLWDSLSKSFMETAQKLNSQNDPNITVSKVSEYPVVQYSLAPLIFFPVAAGLITFALSILIISIKEYLK